MPEHDDSDTLPLLECAGEAIEMSPANRPGRVLLSPLFTWRSVIASEFGPGDFELPPLKGKYSTVVRGSTQRLVGLVLSLHMNERGGSCFPSIETLAAETALSRRTVISSLHALELSGFLKVADARGRERRKRGGVDKGGKGIPVRYTATVPATVQRPHCSSTTTVQPAHENGAAVAPEDVKEDVERTRDVAVVSRELDHDGGADTLMSEVEEIWQQRFIGSRQRAIARAAFIDHPEGARRVALECVAADAPAALFTAKIKAGEHRLNPAKRQRSTAAAKEADFSEYDAAAA